MTAGIYRCKVALVNGFGIFAHLVGRKADSLRNQRVSNIPAVQMALAVAA